MVRDYRRNRRNYAYPIRSQGKNIHMRFDSRKVLTPMQVVVSLLRDAVEMEDDDDDDGDDGDDEILFY